MGKWRLNNVVKIVRTLGLGCYVCSFSLPFRLCVDSRGSPSKFGVLAAPAELSDDRRLGGGRREIGAVGLGGGPEDTPFRGTAGFSPAAASVRRNSTQRRENDYKEPVRLKN